MWGSFQYLKKYIPDFSKKQRYLESSDWVLELLKDNKMSTAITNSEKVLKQKGSENIGKHFPFSRVHLAISKFKTWK
jgi:hypothetical protein